MCLFVFEDVTTIMLLKKKRCLHLLQNLAPAYIYSHLPKEYYFPLCVANVLTFVLSGRKLEQERQRSPSFSTYVDVTLQNVMFNENYVKSVIKHNCGISISAHILFAKNYLKQKTKIIHRKKLIQIVPILSSLSLKLN